MLINIVSEKECTWLSPADHGKCCEGQEQGNVIVENKRQEERLP